MTVKGIEISGTIYDNEDETARSAATTASQTATQASSDVSALQTTVSNISDSVDAIADNLQTVEDNIGDLTDLHTSTKTSLVEAVNEIIPKIQSRPIVKIITTKSSSSNTSELSPADLAGVGLGNLIGSYLVTVHRDTSGSLSYFIGWIDMSTDYLSDASFTKIAGSGNSLYPGGDSLVYSGGDSSDVTTWIFQPIGDTYTEN